MYEKVKKYLDDTLHNMSFMNSQGGKRTFYDHAFGAWSIVYYSFATTEEERSELDFLWQEYRPIFEKEVYGV